MDCTLRILACWSVAGTPSAWHIPRVCRRGRGRDQLIHLLMPASLAAQQRRSRIRRRSQPDTFLITYRNILNLNWSNTGFRRLFIYLLRAEVEPATSVYTPSCWSCWSRCWVRTSPSFLTAIFKPTSPISDLNRFLLKRYFLHPWEIRPEIEWLREIKTADQHCYKFLLIQQNRCFKLNVN